MAENEEKESKGFGASKIIIVIIVLFLICGMYFYAITVGILDEVAQFVNSVLDTLSNPIGFVTYATKASYNTLNYIFDGEGWTPEREACNFTIILDEDQVEELKKKITDQAIELDQASITDYLLKKMILVNYMTTTTSDTEVGIPISKEDYDKKENADIFNYWQGSDEKGKKGEYYMSAFGVISLTDEKGQKIYAYNNVPKDGSNSDFAHFEDTYKYDIENGKNKTAKAVKEAMKYAYTMDNLGSIKMYQVTTTTKKYNYTYAGEEIYSGEEDIDTKIKTIDIDYSNYVSKYVMPMDFLISLLELTASPDFIDGVCDLVKNEKIEVVICIDGITTVKENIKRYYDEVTVEGLQEFTSTTVTNTTTGANTNEQQTTITKSYDLFSETASLQETTSNGQDWNVEKKEVTTIEDSTPSVYVKKAATWYGTATYEPFRYINGKYTLVNESGEEVTTEEEYDPANTSLRDILDEIESKKNDYIWVSKDENFNKTTAFPNDYSDNNFMSSYERAEQRYNNALKQSDLSYNATVFRFKDKNQKLLYGILNIAASKKKFFNHGEIVDNSQQNVRGNIDLGNSQSSTTREATSNPRITQMTEKVTNVKTSEKTTEVSSMTEVSNKAISYVDNTDLFLGLLKNDTGTYVKGAKFNPSGKKVMYKDSYENTHEVSTGDLLVNGSDMLFQFMESTTQYNSNLVVIMKYILQRYTGDSYGIKSFKDAIDWIDIFGNSEFQAGTPIDCLSRWQTSYEGNITTEKGNRYKLLNGANNDGFDSISCAHGFMFFANGYSGFAHEGAINKAYKDFESDMTLAKAIGGLVKGGLIDTSGVRAYNSPIYHLAFPEKYALPVEIVDRGHMYRLQEEMDSVKNALENYNKRNGKKVELTDEQIGAMVDAGWQYGTGKFSYSQFIAAYAKYKDGVNDKDIDNLRSQFLPFYDTKYANRSSARWRLFKEGVYVFSDGTEMKSVPPIERTSSSAGMGGTVVQAATSLVDLTKMGGKEAVAYSGVRSSNGYHSGVYVCASFVSEALYRSSGFKNWSDNVCDLGIGLLNDSNYELVYYNALPGTQPSVADISQSKNLNMNLESEIRPGDIVATFSGSYTFQHVIIYIGDNKYAHHGSGFGAKNYPNVSDNFFASYPKGNIKYIFRYKGK